MKAKCLRDYFDSCQILTKGKIYVLEDYDADSNYVRIRGDDDYLGLYSRTRFEIIEGIHCECEKCK